MTLPKFTEVSDPTIKTLIHMMDMIECGFGLSEVKSFAELKGFSLVAKSKTFKKAKEQILAEIKNSGLILI